LPPLYKFVIAQENPMGKNEMSLYSWFYCNIFLTIEKLRGIIDL